MTTPHPIPTIETLARGLTVKDWPNGKHRTTAEFRVYRSPQGLGERVERRTLKADGTWSAWKRLTYWRIARIAVDSDGKTWAIGLTPLGHVVVTPGTMGPGCQYYSADKEGAELALMLSQSAADEAAR